MLATEAALVNDGLLADLAATFEADEAADDKDRDKDEAEAEATLAALEAEALYVSHSFQQRTPQATYEREAEATEAAEVALAPATLA